MINPTSLTVDEIQTLSNDAGPDNPLASLAELALSSIAADTKPDMFWDASWPERCEESIHNVLAAADAEIGTVIEIQRAVSLNNITIKVTGFDEDKNEYTYEGVKSE